jgi:hypothetical protein
MSAGLSSTWLGGGSSGLGPVARHGILDAQGWRCRSRGESLSEGSMCSMTVPDGIAIVCARCSSYLNGLLLRSQRF